MKKLKAILACLLVCIFAGSVFVGCGADDDKDGDKNPTTPPATTPTTPTKSTEQIIKERFDEAYQMIISSENYVQEITRKKYENGNQVEWDTSNMIPKIITNISEDETIMYVEKGNGGEDVCLVYKFTETDLEATTYSIYNKKYEKGNIPIDQIILEYGDVEVPIMQLKSNFYGVDFDYNKYFDTMLKQLKSQNAKGEYSTKSQSGYEFLIYTITTDSTKYEYTLSIKNNKVSSFRTKIETLEDGSYTTSLTTFRYSGEDLMIDIDFSEFTEKND